jgi:hypothetical protein
MHVKPELRKGKCYLCAERGKIEGSYAGVGYGRADAVVSFVDIYLRMIDGSTFRSQSICAFSSFSCHSLPN